MGLLTEIVKNLITEDISIDRINDAINNLYAVTINYKSNGDDIANGKRLIQPHAYGLTKAGNPVIRAFQPYGDTTTKIPAWKFFRVDRITNWTPHPEEKFSEAPGNWAAEGEFNKNGDRTMSQVFNIANFEGTTGPQADKLQGVKVVGNINDKEKAIGNPEKSVEIEKPVEIGKGVGVNGPIYKGKQEYSGSEAEKPITPTTTSGPVYKDEQKPKSGDNISQYPELYKNFQKSINDKEKLKKQKEELNNIENQNIENSDENIDNNTYSNTLTDKQLSDLQRVKDLMNKT